MAKIKDAFSLTAIVALVGGSAGLAYGAGFSDAADEFNALAAEPVVQEYRALDKKSYKIKDLAELDTAHYIATAFVQAAETAAYIELREQDVVARYEDAKKRHTLIAVTGAGIGAAGLPLLLWAGIGGVALYRRRKKKDSPEAE